MIAPTPPMPGLSPASTTGTVPARPETAAQAGGFAQVLQGLGASDAALETIPESPMPGTPDNVAPQPPSKLATGNILPPLATLLPSATAIASSDRSGDDEPSLRATHAAELREFKTHTVELVHDDGAAGEGELATSKQPLEQTAVSLLPLSPAWLALLPEPVRQAGIRVDPSPASPPDTALARARPVANEVAALRALKPDAGSAVELTLRAIPGELPIAVRSEATSLPATAAVGPAPSSEVPASVSSPSLSQVPVLPPQAGRIMPSLTSVDTPQGPVLRDDAPLPLQTPPRSASTLATSATVASANGSSEGAAAPTITPATTSSAPQTGPAAGLAHLTDEAPKEAPKGQSESNPATASIATSGSASMIVPTAPAAPASFTQAPPTSAVPGVDARDFETLVSRLHEAREGNGAPVVRTSLVHAQFGPVSLQFRPDATGTNVTLQSADPQFAGSVQSAAAAVLAGAAAQSGDTPRDGSPPSHHTPSSQSPATSSGSNQGSDARSSGGFAQSAAQAGADTSGRQDAPHSGQVREDAPDPSRPTAHAGSDQIAPAASGGIYA